MKYQIPSVDPANEGDLTGAFNHILDKWLQGIDDMIPARVVSFDRAKNRVTVQPLIKILTTQSPTIGLQRAQITSLPVIQFGGGGFVVLTNLQAGDLGWIKSNDRDISTFLQNYTVSAPNTLRKHSFSDAVFIPDVMKGWTLGGDDAQNMVIQNLSGTVKISLGTDSINIVAPHISMVSTTLTHNGVNIGSTHTHPQGADSAGNSQQETGYPQ